MGCQNSKSSSDEDTASGRKREAASANYDAKTDGKQQEQEKKPELTTEKDKKSLQVLKEKTQIITLDIPGHRRDGSSDDEDGGNDFDLKSENSNVDDNSEMEIHLGTPGSAPSSALSSITGMAGLGGHHIHSNPYEELQEKCSGGLGIVAPSGRPHSASSVHSDRSIASTTSHGAGTGGLEIDIPEDNPNADLPLSNLSMLMPHPAKELETLRRHYEGGFTAEPTDHVATPRVYMPTVLQRVEHRTRELSAFFAEGASNDPHLVLGRGMLLRHVGFFNEPLPVEAFKMMLPKYRAWFLQVNLKIRTSFEQGDYCTAVGECDQLEFQATTQRCSYLNGLAKVIGGKIRDLAHLESHKKHFLQLLRESGDVEQYRMLFEKQCEEAGIVGIRTPRRRGGDQSGSSTPHFSRSATDLPGVAAPSRHGSCASTSSVRMSILGSIPSVFNGGPLDAHTPRILSSEPTVPLGGLEDSQQGTQQISASGGSAISGGDSTPRGSPQQQGRTRTSSTKTHTSSVSRNSTTSPSEAGTPTSTTDTFSKFIHRQLKLEVRYALLALDCFICRSLNETARAAAWTPPQVFSAM